MLQRKIFVYASTTLSKATREVLCVEAGASVYYVISEDAIRKKDFLVSASELYELNSH